MKATGIIRRVDEVGRVVLPKELRKVLQLEYVEIFVEGDEIILKRYAPSCIFCNTVEDIVEFEGKKICPSCSAKIQQLVSAKD